MIVERLRKSKLIPVIVLQDADDAVPLCRALKAGGLHVAEFTFRTAAAAEAIRRVRAELPEFIVGAGTVTTIEEVKAAAAAGAQFALAPGTNASILKAAADSGLPFFPGITTATEIELALECGARVLKFFPAGLSGGPAMLAALHGVYSHRGVEFIPTGGINADNVDQYLSTRGVVAVGGTWMVPPKGLQAQAWHIITDATHAAVAKVAAMKL